MAEERESLVGRGWCGSLLRGAEPEAEAPGVRASLAHDADEGLYLGQGKTPTLSDKDFFLAKWLKKVLATAQIPRRARIVPDFMRGVLVL